jgi:hypothetical protein
MRRSRSRWVLVLGWTLALATSAEPPPEQPRRVAVIIGANAAVAGRSALRYSHDDARGFAEVLTEVGDFQKDDVTVLLDPRPADVLTAIDRQLASLAALPQGSLFLFYYSGHADNIALYPAGLALPIADLRKRLESAQATVRVGILDACRGGGWTRAKGLEPDAPFEVELPLGLTSEGSVMVASSSGLESAHESAAIHGSFFTHHLASGLRGAADQNGDGEVTVAESFEYAKERTIRDSALQTGDAQHPSFDMNLRGRSEVVLTRAASSGTRVELVQTRGPLQVIQLSSGLVVAEVLPGKRALAVAVRPGRYLVRRRSTDGTFAREVAIEANHATTVAEETLELVGSTRLAAKAADTAPYAIATTLPQGRYQLSPSVTVSPRQSSGLTLELPGLGFGLDFSVGLTDRLEMTIPFPGFVYRFGNRGGVEVLTGVGARPGVVECGKDCFKPVYSVATGLLVRWWLSDRIALNGGVMVSHFGDFTGTRPFTVDGTAILGFSLTAYDIVTMNLGVAFWVDPIAPGAFGQESMGYAIGGVQTLGLRRLPLVQVHLWPTVSLDLDLAFNQSLKTSTLHAAFGGGFSWAF